MGYENPIRTLGYYSRRSHEGYQNTLELPDGNNVVPLRSDTIRNIKIFYDHVNLATRRTIDQSIGNNLCDKNVKESWALLEDLALCDNKSWNDPRDFANPVKAISLPQDVPSTSDLRLTELKNQVQRLMEAHLALKTSFQVNKIASLCEICSGPHDTQYFMENPEQAFVDYASSRNNKVGGEHNRNSSPKRIHFVNTITIIRKEDKPKEEEIVEPNAIKDNNHNTTVKMEEKVGRELSGSKTVIGEGESSDIKRDNPDDRACGDTKEVEVEEESEESEEEVKEEEDDPEYINTFPTVKEFGYYEWILKSPRPPWVSAKIDLESPINVMSRLNHYWIMSEGLKSRRKPSNPEKFSNFVWRVKGLKVFVGDDSDQEKTHYSDSLNLGHAYRRDESVTKAIQYLIKMKGRTSIGGVTTCVEEFLQERNKFFIDARDGVRINLDGVTSPATVIFDEEKPESS
ncbi:hypothetical protein Tco_1327095 [Tanacetum coccineum]